MTRSLPPYGLRDPEYHAQPRPEDVDWSAPEDEAEPVKVPDLGDSPTYFTEPMGRSAAVVVYIAAALCLAGLILAIVVWIAEQP